jgi:biotin operon repressor
LSDSEWVIFIAALLKDKSPEAKSLAKRMMADTRHGRMIRMIRLLRDKPMRGKELQKTLRIGRRTVFRYLNHLEEMGVDLTIDEKHRYRVTKTPQVLSRVL